MPENTKDNKQGLRRLEPEFYRGHAWVHWNLTIQERRTGWLDGRFLYRFRELLTHAAFRYQIACPIYCLMPDHIHLLWTGLSDRSDQRIAMKSFRGDLNDSLMRLGFLQQRQPYEHVLSEEEYQCDGIEGIANYIARNPERKDLVPIDGFAGYAYTGCLMPGAATLKLFTGEGWDRVWRTLSFLRRTECHRIADPKYTKPPAP